MIPCENFIVPVFQSDECLGETKPASCVRDSSIYSELSLEANSTQQQINQAQYLASLNTKLVTDNLQTQIDVLGGSIPDGSETKVTAGTNVSVTGTGTITTPYIIESILQDLQSVLDIGSFAEVDSGQSYVDILSGSPQNRIFNVGLYSTVGNNNSTEFYVDPYSINFYNSGTTKEGGMNVNSGEFYLYAKNKTLNLNTTLRFNTPIVDTTIYLPAKTVAGDYIINTTSDTIYTVSTLPTGVLNDMAIVSDATAPTYLGALVGGGSVVTPVWYNGTSWVSR